MGPQCEGPEAVRSPYVIMTRIFDRNANVLLLRELQARYERAWTVDIHRIGGNIAQRARLIGPDKWAARVIEPIGRHYIDRIFIA